MTDLPHPLTPADCDLRDFAFMPLDVVRLRDSDLAVTAEADEFRCAVLLWCAAWHQVPAASLPDDDKALAQYAGYGRVVKEWQKVRDGALRGWIKCNDGRLYHPVVAEKAQDAWIGKLKQRLKTECARIKKHNDRHGTSIPFPDFESWMCAGCPVGQSLHVPRDKTNRSQGTEPPCPDPVPIETPSKGQGEGQGEGQLTLKALSGGASDSEYDDNRLPPRPTLSDIKPDGRAVAICTLLTGAGVRKVTAFHPDVAVTWAQDERVTDTLLLAAVAKAKESLGDETFQAAYLRPIIVELLNPKEAKAPKGEDWTWKKSDQGIQRKANELGIRAHGNMSYRDLADKCEAEIQRRKGARA